MQLTDEHASFEDGERSMNNFRLLIFLLIFPVAFVLAGCIPLLTVTQPKAEIVVTSEDGAPVEGALVIFASQLYGPGGDTTFVRVRTDQSGMVRLDKESYIQIAVLAVDGVAIYGFSYCIEKTGFQPVVRNSLSNKYFKDLPLRESLARSHAGGSCVWNEDLRGDYFSAATS